MITARILALLLLLGGCAVPIPDRLVAPPPAYRGQLTPPSGATAAELTPASRPFLWVISTAQRIGTQAGEPATFRASVQSLPSGDLLHYRADLLSAQNLAVRRDALYADVTLRRDGTIVSDGVGGTLAAKLSPEQAALIARFYALAKTSRAPLSGSRKIALGEVVSGLVGEGEVKLLGATLWDGRRAAYVFQLDGDFPVAGGRTGQVHDYSVVDQEWGLTLEEETQVNFLQDGKVMSQLAMSSRLYLQ